MSLSDFLIPGRSAALTLGVALGILLATAVPAEAQRAPLPTEEFTDPLDGTRFKAAVLPSVNSLGGTDSDGCSYSSGLQARHFAVVTSPTSLYSARIEDWGKGVTAANKEKLLRLLVPLGADVSGPESLSPADRYGLAAVVADVLGRDHFTVGEFHLHGAWTVRDTIVGFLPNVQGSADAWQKLDELWLRSQQLKDSRAKTIALFDMARLAHRGGFVHERDYLLSMLDHLEDAGLGALDKRTEFFRRVSEEKKLLRKARERFLKGVSLGQRSGSERQLFRVLAADLARRMGDFTAASSELDSLTMDKGIPPEVKGLITDLTSVMKVQARSAAAAGEQLSGESK